MDADLVVDPDEIARLLRIPLPLAEADHWVIEQAIRYAQVDVESYLGRPITVREFVEHGREERCGGWRLSESPVLEIVSATPEPAPSCTWTVTYRAGLDVPNDRRFAPIVRYVREHAMWGELVQGLQRRLNLADTRTAKSISVTGQSVTYERVHDSSAAKPGSGVPGSLPTLESLDRWRVRGRRVYQRETQHWEPWPYDSRSYSGQWWW